MLQQEKVTAKAAAKGGKKIVSFDMNEGLVGKMGKEGGATTEGDNLDDDIEMIKRKTLAVKADNINNMFMENIGAIKESVDTFQQMEEETIQNDPRLLYQQEEENYELEILKLKQKLEKQHGIQGELQNSTTGQSEELLELIDHKQQYLD